MRVRVVAFASAAEALGTRQQDVELADGSRVGDLLDALESVATEFTPIRERLAIAVDGRLVQKGEPLADGSEVALLPPVSGGRPAAPAQLIHGEIDIEALLEETADPSCGAQLLFLGRVRQSRDDEAITHLSYEAYEPMALAALERICRELGSSELRIRLVHRLGEVPVGEPSVAIAVASPHRSAAYEASRTALERLKREVPIWKKEHYADGSSIWREEQPITAKGTSWSGARAQARSPASPRPNRRGPGPLSATRDPGGS